MTPVRANPTPAPRFSRFTNRLLSELAIGGLWGWFVLKRSLPSDTGLVEIASGVLAVGAVVAGMTLMFSRYAHQAHDTSGTIDERELAQRNQAHLWTVLYVLVATAGGYVGIDLAEGRVGGVSSGFMQNFLTVLFLTTLWFPAAVLAWQDIPDADDA